MRLLRPKRRSIVASCIGVALPPSDMQAWINAVAAAGGTVSEGRQTIINNAITSLKAQSCSLGGTLWSSLDFLFIHAGEDSQQGLISIINPAQRQATNEGATFTANEGFAGNGTSTYVNLGYNPATNGSNYQLNSASVGFFWATTPTEFGQVGAEAGDGSYATVCPNYYGTVSKFGVNDNSSQVEINSPVGEAGFYAVSRTGASSSAVTGYFNGTGTGGNQASTGIPTQDLWIGGFNQNGVFGGGDTATIALSFAGAGFDSADVANLNTIVQSLATAIGF